MNLDVICKIISDAGAGKVGETLFQDRMPEGCKNGILLRRPIQGIPVNHELPGYFKSSLQVIVRSTDNVKGEAKAKTLMPLLHIYNQEYRDAEGNFLMKINYLRPKTLPIVYPRSAGNSIEVSINFDACYLLNVDFS